VPRDLNDPRELYWTIDQAADHFGMTRRSMRRYIQDGLPVYLGLFVKRAEVIAEYRRRMQRRHATRGGSA
jgi:hypothetical protein